MLKMIGTAEPVYVSLTLVGVRGRTMALPRRLQMLNSVSPPFDRDVIVSPDVMVQNLEEGYPFATTLIPLVDSVWQAAGLEGTPNINNDREWEV